MSVCIHVHMPLQGTVSCQILCRMLGTFKIKYSIFIILSMVCVLMFHVKALRTSARLQLNAATQLKPQRDRRLAGCASCSHADVSRALFVISLSRRFSPKSLRSSPHCRTQENLLSVKSSIKYLGRHKC
ncbi:hypothetical protein AOLI_G00186880 [Acnodon oligacanthus]